MNNVDVAETTQVKSSFIFLLISPLVGCLYYFSSRYAFIAARPYAVTSEPMDLDRWWSVPQGYDILYFIIGEAFSVHIAVLIVAGLARGREMQAALVTSSLLFIYLLITSIWILMSHFSWFNLFLYLFITIMPFIIMTFSAYYAYAVNSKYSVGFFGINEFHFTWLWLPLCVYVGQAVPPIWKLYGGLYTSSIDGHMSIFGLFANLLVHVLPIAFIVLPAYWGILLLNGRLGSQLHSGLRQAIGSAVVIVGLLLGAALSDAWYILMRKIFL